MKLLVDTNVLLDLALGRVPFDVDARDLLERVARGDAAGYVAGHAITTLYYIVRNKHGPATAEASVRDAMLVCEVVPLAARDFEDALAFGFTDFEDAVHAAAARKVAADFVVTRDLKHFRTSPVRAMLPADVLRLM